MKTNAEAEADAMVNNAPFEHLEDELTVHDDE
ncbi:hypothetical protein ACVWZZ_005573 [Bradyrhizobium sp. LM6.10]